MSGTELLAIARTGRPNVRYAMHKSGESIAAFIVSAGRWVPVAALLIDGSWASMEHELLVNGKPVHQQEDWIE